MTLTVSVGTTHWGRVEFKDTLKEMAKVCLTGLRPFPLFRGGGKVKVNY